MYEATRPTSEGGGKMAAESRTRTESTQNTSQSPNRSPQRNTKKNNIWRHSHSLALHDLKSRWRRGLLWTTFLAVAIVFILALGIAISSSTPGNKPTFDDSVACLPDGRFSLDPDEFDFWGYGGFFEITMGYGEFSFSGAKAIDVAWDVVVGRGGQALLALISSSVFARYITTTMQASPITFNTFKTIFVARDANTAMGACGLIRDFTRRKSLPNKVATVFMVATMVFILVFPTFVSSMSGYSANVQSFVEDESKRYVPFQDFSLVYYTIHDGEKIYTMHNGKKLNLVEDFRITNIGRTGKSVSQLCDIMWTNWRPGESLLHTGSVCSTSWAGAYQEQCDLMDDVTNYILDYGVESATNDDTTFGRDQIKISAPSLNITVHYIPQRYLVNLNRRRGISASQANRNMWEVATPDGGKLNPFDTSRMLWIAGENPQYKNMSSTYDQAYIDAHGKCQPTKTYKWGFSFIQLFIMVLLLTLWSIGTYTLYIRSHIAMLKRNIHAPVAGEYQAIFQLADAMNSQLEHEPESVEKAHRAVIGEEELRRRITGDLKGGRISYKDSLLHEGNARGEGKVWKTRDYVKKEMWWLILLVLAVVVCLLTPWFFPYVVATYMLPLQVLFAMYVGQCGKSRVVLLAWMVVGLSVVPTAVVLGMTLSSPR